MGKNLIPSDSMYNLEDLQKDDKMLAAAADGLGASAIIPIIIVVLCILMGIGFTCARCFFCK